MLHEDLSQCWVTSRDPPLSTAQARTLAQALPAASTAFVPLPLGTCVRQTAAFLWDFPGSLGQDKSYTHIHGLCPVHLPRLCPRYLLVRSPNLGRASCFLS